VNRKESSDEDKNTQATVHLKAATDEIPKAYLFTAVAETAITCHKPYSTWWVLED